MSENCKLAGICKTRGCTQGARRKQWKAPITLPCQAPTTEKSILNQKSMQSQKIAPQNQKSMQNQLEPSVFCEKHYRRDMNTRRNAIITRNLHLLLQIACTKPQQQAI